MRAGTEKERDGGRGISSYPYPPLRTQQGRMVRLGWSVDDGPPTLLRVFGIVIEGLFVLLIGILFIVAASGVPA